jgi:hypothetical protein
MYSTAPSYTNTRRAIERAFPNKTAHGDGVTLTFVVEGVGVFRYLDNGAWRFYRKNYMLSFTSRKKMLAHVVSKLNEVRSKR